MILLFVYLLIDLVLLMIANFDLDGVKSCLSWDKSKEFMLLGFMTVA